MIWMTVLMATAALTPNGQLPVRLVPVTCAGFSDANVRAALQVEIRERLVPEVAPAPPDFALVSVTCAGEDAELLVVRQGTGTPVRRLVPLADVAPDARPRAVAIAAAELLRVDLARNEPPPPPPPAPPPRVAVFSLDVSPFGVGRYFTGRKTYWFTSFQMRFSFERATDPSAGRRWAWGLALVFDLNDLNAFSYAQRSSDAGGLAAVVSRHGTSFAWQVGAGGRMGEVSDYSIAASPSAARIYGPFGFVALEMQSYGRWFSRMLIDGGRDSGPLGGGWARLMLGIGARF